MTNQQSVLVSGAGGFLGKEVVRQLLASSDFQVTALSSSPEKLLRIFPNAEHLTVLPTNDWTEQLGESGKIDFCINCAFPRSSKPALLAEGLDFTETFIQDVIDRNITNIINISSQSVYSQKEKADTDETVPAVPESLYGMAKYAGERIVSSLCKGADRKINYANIRLASLTGREFEVRMTNRFVKRALHGETITINGGSQKISYLDVRDAAAALLAMLQKDPRDWQNTYNLGNEHVATVLEVAQAVEQTAKKYAIENVDVQLNTGLDDFNNLIDSSRFYEDFSWKPHYTIPLMIEDLFEYYTSQQEKTQ